MNEYAVEYCLTPRKNEILLVATKWILEVGDSILNEVSQTLHVHNNV